MSSILEAANVSTDKDGFIIGELPTKVGDVSIMTIEEFYTALGGPKSNPINETCDVGICDPVQSYNNSIYRIYAITDIFDTNGDISESILDNLHRVGKYWFKELNKPTYNMKYWTVGRHQVAGERHIVFGGPLSEIRYHTDNTYSYSWYYSFDEVDMSCYSDYWGCPVPGSVYVVIARAR